MMTSRNWSCLHVVLLLTSTLNRPGGAKELTEATAPFTQGAVTLVFDPVSGIGVVNTGGDAAYGYGITSSLGDGLSGGSAERFQFGWKTVPSTAVGVSAEELLGNLDLGVEFVDGRAIDAEIPSSPHLFYIAPSAENSYVLQGVVNTQAPSACYGSSGIRVDLGMGLRVDGSTTHGLVRVNLGGAIGVWGSGIEGSGYYNDAEDFDLSTTLLIEDGQASAPLRMTPTTVEVGPISGGPSHGCSFTALVIDSQLSSDRPGNSGGWVIEDGAQHVLSAQFDDVITVRNQSTLIVQGTIVEGDNSQTADQARLAVEHATLVIDGGSLDYPGLHGTPPDYLVLSQGADFRMHSGAITFQDAAGLPGIKLMDSNAQILGGEVKLKNAVGGDLLRATGNSTVTMQAGHLSVDVEHEGMVVAVAGTSQFNLAGGEILVAAGRSAGGTGSAAVSLTQQAQFQVTGGRIHLDRFEQGGVAVQVADDAIFSMNYGEVSANTRAGEGQLIHLTDSAQARLQHASLQLQGATHVTPITAHGAARVEMKSLTVQVRGLNVVDSQFIAAGEQSHVVVSNGDYRAEIILDDGTNATSFDWSAFYVTDQASLVIDTGKFATQATNHDPLGPRDATFRGVLASGSAHVDIRGGEIALTIADAFAVDGLPPDEWVLRELEIRENATIVLRGNHFNLPLFDPVESLTGVVTGTLADGSPVSWRFERDTTATLMLLPYILGDYSFDGVINAADVDLQAAAIRDAGTNLGLFDTNGDAIVNETDRANWVHDIAQTWFGDSDLNGIFDSSDLIQVFQAGQYEDNVVGNSTWSTGDWDGDGEVSSSDLVIAFQDGGYDQGPKAVMVPEPTLRQFVMMVCLVMTVLGHRLTALRLRSAAVASSIGR